MAKKDESQEPTPQVVQRAGVQRDDETLKRDEKVTPSARSEFWANAADRGTFEDETPSQKEQMTAFDEYQDRPDIESRNSILARETAAPGQFSESNVRSGAVDDGMEGSMGTPTKETKEAEAEAKSISNQTAKK